MLFSQQDTQLSSRIRVSLQARNTDLEYIMVADTIQQLFIQPGEHVCHTLKLEIPEISFHSIQQIHGLSLHQSVIISTKFN